MATTVRLSERQALTEASVTLNGQPARVTGYRNAYATVTRRADRLSAEWCWESVRLIVRNGGRFQT